MKKFIKKITHTAKSAVTCVKTAAVNSMSAVLAFNRRAVCSNAGEGYIDTAVKVLIAVVLGASSGKERFEAAKTLLDYGFAHYDSAEVEQKGQHYLYPHDYPNHWVAQQYLPDDLVGTQYYRYGDNKTEQAARAYWEARKKEK